MSADSRAVTVVSLLGALGLPLELYYGCNHASSFLSLDRAVERSCDAVMPFVTQRPDGSQYADDRILTVLRALSPHNHAPGRHQDLMPGKEPSPSTDNIEKVPILLKSREQLQLLPFPLKLFLILSIPEYQAVISWMHHGQAWKIHDIDKFVTDILPFFFDGSGSHNLTTFIIELRLHGFHQFAAGPNKSAYYHDVRVVERVCVCFHV